jgi:hypothetical protein
MKRTLFALALAALVVSVLFAAESPNAALTGTVTSQAEPKMEGVVVSAKRAASTITVSVISDAQGRYTFPQNRLEPRLIHPAHPRHRLRPREPSTVNVVAGKPTEFDLKLKKTQDLSAQLTNGEWFMSWPGSADIKNGLLNCTQCHSLQPSSARSSPRSSGSACSPAWGATRRAARPRVRNCGQATPPGGAILAQSMDGREGRGPRRS